MPSQSFWKILSDAFPLFVEIAGLLKYVVLTTSPSGLDECQDQAQMGL